MSKNLIIGVGGYGRSGKDTLADLLVESFDFVKMSFAEPMRAIARSIDPVVGFIEDRPLRYCEAVEVYGYNDAKEIFPEVRQFLQRLGTDGVRDILGDDVWVNYLLENARQHPRVVVADMRFINEAEAIRRNGGWTVRVERHGVGPANSHRSEHDLADWRFDLWLRNNGRPVDMLTTMEQFFARHAPEVTRIR